jgi:EAL domain-containing protein (putative c-di-GMP-specific phosphodiesterase class I)
MDSNHDGTREAALAVLSASCCGVDRGRQSGVHPLAPKQRPPTPRRPSPRIDDGVRIAAELRRGIGAGELRLHYQPIFGLSRYELAGVEALVRWQHPRRGLLAPGAFIELAERAGLVDRLGDWVAREAIQAAVRFESRHDFPLRVGVNLSAVQLSGDAIVGTVRDALELHGCPADRLILEITETGLLADMDTAVAVLCGLKELGARLAIDDFGTGYATIQYLSRLPADSLKIDGSFVSAIGTSPQGTALVASLVSLAHNLDVQCVAEGVETAAQLRILDQIGCDFVQGYLLARPMDEARLNSWFSTHGAAHRGAPVLTGADRAVVLR